MTFAEAKSALTGPLVFGNPKQIQALHHIDVYEAVREVIDNGHADCPECDGEGVVDCMDCNGSGGLTRWRVESMRTEDLVRCRKEVLSE